ncbi:hypothetical protein BGZ59_011611 [Podila verticillata]|nr:hypothetical protein BGZ59_011611 [Podila verticillata]
MSNVLSILFGYAYCFADLKSVVLKHVTKNHDNMFAGDRSPFNDYEGHPEHPKIKAEIMKLKFSLLFEAPHTFLQPYFHNGLLSQLPFTSPAPTAQHPLLSEQLHCSTSVVEIVEPNSIIEC